MVDYNNANKIHIEDLNEEINILGVRPQGMLIVLLAFTVGMVLGSPWLGFIVGLISCLYFRWSYKKELAGQAVCFAPKVLNLVSSAPFLKHFIAGVDAIHLPKEIYREEL